MEREFYTKNFENLLKENADQFKLSPSKKVWHGIYNDLHPGRRWPSAVMSLAFIFTLVIIGHLNTQQSQHIYYLTPLQKSPQLQKDIQQEQEYNDNLSNKSLDNISQKNIVRKTNRTIANVTNKYNEKLTVVGLKNSTPFSNSEITHSEKNYETEIINTSEQDKNLIENNKPAYLENVTPLTQKEFSKEIIAPITFETTNIATNINTLPAISTISSPTKKLVKTYQSDKNIGANSKRDKILNTVANDGKSHVLALKIHKNSNIRWSYYLSPSVSHRTYSNHEVNTNQIFNTDVTQHPSLGFEAGTLMKYSLTKKLKFLSGFQANYSAYTVQANNIHPIMATLLLYDKERVSHLTSAISFYGNGPGSAPINLHNYSLQVSIPVGFEYKIAGNDDVQLNASATLQPLYVVVNKAYILSTDKKNYITQASLSRKWNMSTNFGTYISFNSNKFNWQLGPQVHYQLLSSYSSAYPLKEHFINYGIRLGVSKLVR